MSTKKQTQPAAGEPAEELLDDLESIKELLDEDDELMAEDQQNSKAVPLLDDLVDGALTLDEPDLSDRTGTLEVNFDDSRETQLDEALFDALLGDSWRDAASDLLTQARGAIEAHRNDWSPEDTDELNEALRVRIDETLSAWLQKTLKAHMHELRTELLRAAETTINDRIALLTEQALRTRDAKDEDQTDNHG